MHQVMHLPTFSLLFPTTAPLEVILAHFAREANEAQRGDVLYIPRYMVREVPLSEFILRTRTIVLNHDAMWLLIIATLCYHKMLCEPCQKKWLRKAACDRISTLLSSTFIEELAWHMPAQPKTTFPRCPCSWACPCD